MMNNRYLLLFTIATLFGVTRLSAQQYSSDVKTFPRPANSEGPVSLDVAFNGWIYESFALDSGFAVVMSKDNGNTWITIDSSTVNGRTYKVKIVVAGTDSNYLRVYQVVNQFIPSTDDNTFYINVYDGNTAGFVSQHIFDEYTYSQPTRDFSIATDYKMPSVISNPYGIGVLYAKSNGYDSLFLISSIDSGATFSNRQVVSSTGGFFRTVSLAYGIAPGWADGRFFMTWDQFASGTDTLGNVYFTVTPDYINDSVFTITNIDSIYTTTQYQLRNPKISVSVTSSAANDSAAMTALIVAERIGTGLSNANILGFSNFYPVLGHYWTGFDIVNTVQDTKQPDLTFDAGYNNFLLTYYNATTKQVPYIVNGFNLTTPGTWIDISNNYVNDSSLLANNPWPTVRINPVYTRAAFGWTNLYGAIPQAMFDAEYRLPTPVITSLEPDTVIAGHAAFELIVNGSQFENNSYIMWNNDSLGSTLVNITQINANITAPQVATAATIPVRVFTPSTTGGGGNSDTLLFYVVVASAINDLGSQNTVMAYPVPASNQLNVAYNFAQAGTIELQLYDMNGQLVKQLANMDHADGHGSFVADVSQIPVGMYQLVINTSQGSTTRKISIVR